MTGKITEQELSASIVSKLDGGSTVDAITFPQNYLIKFDGITVGNFTLSSIPVQLGTVIVSF